MDQNRPVRLDAQMVYTQLQQIRHTLRFLMATSKRIANLPGAQPGIMFIKLAGTEAVAVEVEWVNMHSLIDPVLRVFAAECRPGDISMMAVLLVHPDSTGRSCYLISPMVNLTQFPGGFAVIKETHMRMDDITVPTDRTGGEPTIGDHFSGL